MAAVERPPWTRPTKSTSLMRHRSSVASTPTSHTLRAPIVNSIWRTVVANVPELAPYVWGQMKPAFETREFAAFTVAFRDRVLSPVDDDLPQYTAADVDLQPAEFTELREQLATFDVVAPRLVVAFSLLDRMIRDGSVGTGQADESGTAPFPSWLDAGRGRAPDMLPQPEARAAMPDHLAREFGEMVPSIYRCLAHWPSYLDRVSADLQPVTDAPVYRDARQDGFALAETYLDRLPYTPRIDPDGLAEQGADRETIEALRDMIELFVSGGETILPLLHVHAATVGATGERRTLTFP